MPQQNKSLYILLGVLIAFIFISLVGFAYIQNQIQSLKNAPVTPTDTFTPAMQQFNNETILPFTPQPEAGQPVAETPTPKPTATPFIQTFPKTIYIPLGGGGSTQATDWVDVPNDEVWLDFGSEFGSKAKAVFEAFVRVDNANGTVYARLVDATHGITVNGSEISFDNNSQFNLVVSNNLTFWAGKNLYKVQVKSLNSSTIFLDSARIKVSY